MCTILVIVYYYKMTFTRVGKFRYCVVNMIVRRVGAILGVDLGGSSKQSSEILENRSGKGFHVNSSWTWVNRSLS